ncbi:MAG: lipid-A-disaccharide synthase N-terminal domain-containing protein [Planctomycetota bacterium]
MTQPRPALPLIAAGMLLVIFSATAEPGPQPGDAAAMNLDDRIGDLELARDPDADAWVVTHNGHTLSADQYLGLIAQRQAVRDAGGPLFTLFNITSWVGVLWVTLGLGGQVLFTGRMLLQWLASEKEKRSVVPPLFWYLSLAGASMLLVYFVWRKDIVGVLGQSTGWFIYARNVALIRRPPPEQDPPEVVTPAGDAAVEGA